MKGNKAPGAFNPHSSLDLRDVALWTVTVTVVTLVILPGGTASS